MIMPWEENIDYHNTATSYVEGAKMKYKVGDKVIIDGGDTSVYTIKTIVGDEEYPYVLTDYKGIYKGTFREECLSPAGNLIDPDEATEQFAKDLESGFYDEPIGITPEMMGVTDAVVKGGRMREDEILRESTLAEDRKKAYDRGYARGYSQGCANTSHKISTMRDKENKALADHVYKEAYNDGFKDGQASLAETYAEGKGDDIARQRGKDEAWETIRKLYRNYHDKLKRIFSNNDFSVLEVVMRYSASETIEKLKAYEKEQNTIKVGDEVICDGVKGIVIASKDIENYEYEVLEVDGNTKIWYAPTTHKTGRHFDQISEVLEQMKEE